MAKMTTPALVTLVHGNTLLAICDRPGFLCRATSKLNERRSKLATRGPSYGLKSLLTAKTSCGIFINKPCVLRRLVFYVNKRLDPFCEQITTFRPCNNSFRPRVLYKYDFYLCGCPFNITFATLFAQKTKRFRRTFTCGQAICTAKS